MCYKYVMGCVALDPATSQEFETSAVEENAEDIAAERVYRWLASNLPDSCCPDSPLAETSAGTA